MSHSPDDAPSGSGKRSAKRSASSERTANQVDFQFLNFSHPSDAKASRARRTVRSHVTRQQHQKEQQAAAAVRQSRSQGSEESTLSRPPPQAIASVASQTVAETDAKDELDSSTSVSRVSPSASPPVPSLERTPNRSPGGRIDPMDLYPPEWHSSVNSLLGHYWHNLAIDTPDLDGNNDRGRLRSIWFPFMFTDVALLHTLLLMSAEHCNLTRAPGIHSIDTNALRGMAIRAINNRIENPIKFCGDELIAAVSNMAIFEILYGDTASYMTHMMGLQNMVSLRGGLGSLGLDGLLERMLLWVDSNGSYVLGLELFFDKSRYPSEIPHPTPSPSTFGRTPIYTH